MSVDDADNYTIRGLNSEAKPYNTKIQEEARKNGVLWFSTKEAAEEYILMNKPCLSIQEIVDMEKWIRKDDSFSGSRMVSTFKTMVKSKLNDSK